LRSNLHSINVTIQPIHLKYKNDVKDEDLVVLNIAKCLQSFHYMATAWYMLFYVNSKKL